MSDELGIAIERYNRAASSDDAEEFSESHRILRGRLLKLAIPVAASGQWAYAAVGRAAIEVVRLRRAGE